MFLLEIFQIKLLWTFQLYLFINTSSISYRLVIYPLKNGLFPYLGWKPGSLIQVAFFHLNIRKYMANILMLISIMLL